MNIAEIVNKYEDIKIETIKNKMVLNFYSENKIYKILEIRKQKDNFKILILPNKIKKVIKSEELKDLILNIKNQKIQCNTNIEEIRKYYKSGQKVRLIKMYDYISPVPPLTTGLIDYIDDVGTLHITWENGSTLGLIVGVDEFEIICKKCGSRMLFKDNDYYCSKCNKIF